MQKVSLLFAIDDSTAIAPYATAELKHSSSLAGPPSDERSRQVRYTEPSGSWQAPWPTYLVRQVRV